MLSVGLMALVFQVASADTFFVSDTQRAAIIKVDQTGSCTVFADIRGAIGLAFDSSGNLVVASAAERSILKYDPAGIATVFVNTGLDFPTGLAIDRSGNLYVSELNRNVILRFDPAGNSSIFASVGLSGPVGLAFDRLGNLFVANRANNTISKFDSDGNFSVFVSSGLDHPYGLAFDAVGNLYVGNGNETSSNRNDAIMKFDPAGTGTLFASGMFAARGLVFDSTGNLYAIDLSNIPVTKFDQAGNRSAFVTYTSANPSVGLGAFIVAQPGLSTAREPAIVSMSITGRVPRLTFNSASGKNYCLEFCSNLAPGDWAPVTGQENIAGTGAVISVEDEGAATAGLIRGFYRIRILPQSSETKAKLTAEGRARSVMAQP